MDNFLICISDCMNITLLTLGLIFLQIIAELYLFKNHHRNKILHILFDKRLGRGLFTQIMLLFIGAGLVYIAEVRYGYLHSIADSAFYPYGSAVVSMILPATIILGWEAGAPVSVSGKLLATIFNILFIINGIMRIGRAFAAELIKIFTRGKKMIDKPHYLVLGGELKALEIVLEQMTNKALGCRRLPITVMMLRDQKDDIKYLEDHFSHTSLINYRIGSIFDDNELINAGIVWAKSILIMPTKLGQHQPDTTTLFCAKAIDKIFIQNKKERPHIVAKINNPMFGDILVDYVDEIVCSEHRDFWLASAAVFNKGLNTIYNNLIRVSEDTNEIYITNIPAQCVGRSYVETVDYILSETRKTSNSITTIGLKRDGGIYLNPDKNIGQRLLQNDRLIVIARKCPDDEIQRISEGK